MYFYRTLSDINSTILWYPLPISFFSLTVIFINPMFSISTFKIHQYNATIILNEHIIRLCISPNKLFLIKVLNSITYFILPLLALLFTESVDCTYRLCSLHIIDQHSLDFLFFINHKANQMNYIPVRTLFKNSNFLNKIALIPNTVNSFEVIRCIWYLNFEYVMLDCL